MQALRYASYPAATLRALTEGESKAQSGEWVGGGYSKTKYSTLNVAHGCHFQHGGRFPSNPTRCCHL